MQDSIYPGGIRFNNFSSAYCEMAIESFAIAKQSFTNLKQAGFSVEDYEYKDTMDKSIIATIIFSAMAIEAFVNDYAAACLGDSDFYDNFDKLSICSKLELIARFILKTEVDKSKAYYSLLRKLFKQRDYYVHGKSHRLEGNESGLAKKVYVIEEIGPDNSTIAKFNAEDSRNDIRDAFDAIRAIKEIAVFFDKNDSSIHAVSKFFYLSDYYDKTKKMAYIRENILFPLGIKVEIE